MDPARQVPSSAVVAAKVVALVTNRMQRRQSHCFQCKIDLGLPKVFYYQTGRIMVN